MTLCAVSLSGSLWQPPVIGHNSCPSSFNRSLLMLLMPLLLLLPGLLLRGMDLTHFTWHNKKNVSAGSRFSSSSPSTLRIYSHLIWLRFYCVSSHPRRKFFSDFFNSFFWGGATRMQMRAHLHKSVDYSAHFTQNKLNLIYLNLIQFQRKFCPWNFYANEPANLHKSVNCPFHTKMACVRVGKKKLLLIHRFIHSTRRLAHSSASAIFFSTENSIFSPQNLTNGKTVEKKPHHLHNLSKNETLFAPLCYYANLITQKLAIKRRGREKKIH